MSAKKWSLKHTLRVVAVSGLIASGVGSADAQTLHKVNASSIGNSWRLLNWLSEAGQTPVPCSPSCNYMRVSTAKRVPDTETIFTPTNWPNASYTSFPSPTNVERELAFTPPDSRIYESTVSERGAVDYARTGEASISTTVFQSGGQPSPTNGAAAAAVAYHVEVQNPSPTARDYFVHFIAPKSLTARSYSKYLMNNQYFYFTQQYAKGRSSVDVLVNGLPVWSSASSYFFPDDYTGAALSGFETEWGSESSNDEYKIFIGRFNPGATFFVDFIVRADSVARAPTCGSETPAGPTPVTYAHCFLLTEGRDLPAVSGNERFRIYSEDFSTTPIQNIPLP